MIYGMTLALFDTPRPFVCSVTLRDKRCRTCEHLNSARQDRLHELALKGVAARSDQHLWNQAQHDTKVSPSGWTEDVMAVGDHRECGCKTCKRYLRLVKRRGEALAQL